MPGKNSDHNLFIFEKNEKSQKCLELPDLARKFIKREVLRIFWFGEKVDQKNFQTILPPLPPPRHVRRKISAGVDGGLSGGSSVRRPGSEDPHRHQRKFSILCKLNRKVIEQNMNPECLNPRNPFSVLYLYILILAHSYSHVLVHHDVQLQWVGPGTHDCSWSEAKIFCQLLVV